MTATDDMVRTGVRSLKVISEYRETSSEYRFLCGTPQVPKHARSGNAYERRNGAEVQTASTVRTG